MSLTILYVGGHRVAADAVKETLEAEGWRVVVCTDGTAALRKISSLTRYDLLILDHHPPNVDAPELASYARQLRHRQDISIIMLSATLSDREAYGSGISLFLKKPEGITSLVQSIHELT
ncbi:MAG TPA: response regulator [Pyrinomonadaceae bacterium]|jgi:CheY-like chemotaxis protein